MQDDTPVSYPVPNALLSEVVALRRRTEDLELRTRHLTASALLQDLRSGAQASQAYHVQQELRLIQSSRMWRATWPLRLMLDVLRGAPPEGSREALFLRRVFATAKRRGVRAGVAELAGGLGRQRSRRRQHAAAATLREAAGQSETASAKQPLPCEVLAPNVLIIAELTLPQCAKYRVWQKQESFLRLGVPCRVVDWRMTQECLAAAALATQVILYRVPGYPNILKLIAQLNALHLPLAWEVDDLIFDRELFLKNRNVDELDPDLRESIVSGVDLYRAAMLACGSGIASTFCLAETMRGAGLGDVVVVENALDRDTLALAEALRARRIARDDDDENGDVLITYGSGTKNA